MVAPYFADADSRGSGMVYYRWTDDATLLNRAKQDIGVSDFEPDSLFIATWDNIGFYDQHSNLVNPPLYFDTMRLVVVTYLVLECFKQIP